MTPHISSLVVTVWDENKSSRDRILGKLQLPLAKVKEEPTEEWYPLTFASANAFVSGDIHIRIEWPEGEDFFMITVVEARNVGIHSYGTLILSLPSSLSLHADQRQISTSTRIVRKRFIPRNNPKWRERENE
jgi:hypothetical protein